MQLFGHVEPRITQMNLLCVQIYICRTDRSPFIQMLYLTDSHDYQVHTVENIQTNSVLFWSSQKQLHVYSCYVRLFSLMLIIIFCPCKCSGSTIVECTLFHDIFFNLLFAFLFVSVHL